MVTIKSENMAPKQPSSIEEQSGELCEPESEEGEKQGSGTPSDQAHAVTYDAPDGGWGWVVLVATILVLALTLAFPSCIGIFYLDLQEEFQASNSETSWVPSIMTAVLHAGGKDVIEKSDVSSPLAQPNETGFKQVSQTYHISSICQTKQVIPPPNLWHYLSQGFPKQMFVS